MNLKNACEIAFEFHLLLDLAHLAVNPRDFLQAQVVDFVAGQIRRRRPPQRELIIRTRHPGTATRRLPRARVFSCASRNAISFW